MPAAPTAIPHDLRRDLVRAGYYPELVADVLDVALGAEEVVAHLVHPETTFDDVEVRRHLTVLVLTGTRLVAHVDDQPADSENPSASALATTESVPLRELRSVGLTHVVPQPERHRPGKGSTAELTLAVGWGAVSRIELEPASCGDPDCEADHGYTGTTAPEDVVLRVSAAAEGAEAVRAAVGFARRLSAASVGRS